MVPFSLITLVTFTQFVSCHDLIFPEGFKFGAATAAYQVEGAWNVSDKGESMWDRYVHTHPERIADGTTGDVACDSYHQWKRDVEVAKELGLHFYRFSINWPRLLPNGVPTKISEAGSSYYNNLINELIKNDIEPVITLYHWELPQRFQDLGGWTNPLIVDWFGDYVRIVYSLFGDRVKTWITINEPMGVCDMSYNHGMLAPGLIDFDFATYICTKNVLMAHAKAWRVYDEEFKPKYGGTYDYFGLNFYTSRTIRKPKPGEKVPAVMFQGIPELNLIIDVNPKWPPTMEGHWLLVYPRGFRRQLNWVRDRYGDVEMMIFENGCPAGNILEDHDRIHYYQVHLEQVLLAIKEDKLNITHYTAWTMIDNFEWMDGYRTKFGLYQVDFTKPSRPRIPRQSAKFYSELIRRNKKNFQVPL